MQQKENNSAASEPKNEQLIASLENKTSSKKMSRVEVEAKARKDNKATNNIAAIKDGNAEFSEDGQIVQSDSQLRTVQSNKHLGKTRRAIIVRKNQEHPRSKIAAFANLLSYVAVGLAAIFLGVFAGNLYIAANNRINYNFDESLYTPDWSAVYDANKGTPATSVSAANAYVMAEWQLMTQAGAYAVDNFSIEGTGYVSATVMGIVQKQQVVKHISKTPTQIVNESLSGGLISAAEKLIYNLETQTIDSYRSKNVTSGENPVATYSDEPTTSYNLDTDYQAYRDEYGISPYVVFPYLVSENTVVSSSGAKAVDNGYEYTMTLSNLYGVMNYVYYMMHISGLSQEPTFYELTMTFVVDSKYQMQSLYVYERYQIYYLGLPANCVAETTYLVSYNKSK